MKENKPRGDAKFEKTEKGLNSITGYVTHFWKKDFLGYSHGVGGIETLDGGHAYFKVISIMNFNDHDYNLIKKKNLGGTKPNFLEVIAKGLYNLIYGKMDFDMNIDPSSDDYYKNEIMLEGKVNSKGVLVVKKTYDVGAEKSILKRLIFEQEKNVILNVLGYTEKTY